ncbi:hypothetical protein PLUA15_280022 [Pseudomonas lundensis]|uniref:Uncharacterized protein n=1 Tax=Pseudomonas lundensis TaxID=86185 RepID=A0AAX2H9Z6_9PSED|nr:hypothetical protein PLUA15_280022 [Pseudomonas lundensis]
MAAKQFSVSQHGDVPGAIERLGPALALSYKRHLTIRGDLSFPETGFRPCAETACDNNP